MRNPEQEWWHEEQPHGPEEGPEEREVDPVGAYWRDLDEDTPGCACASLAVLVIVVGFWLAIWFSSQVLVEWARGVLK